jgi:uncharacterized protein (TIGR02246 family)
MIKAIVCAMFLLPVGVFAQAAPSAAETDVLAVVNRLIEGLNKGDSALARSTFHPKARLITVDLQRAEGTAPRIEESAEAFIQSLGRPRNQVFEEKLSNVKVMIDRALASVWADYTFHIGTRLNHCGADHFLLVKEAGAWKIIELADTRRREGC